MAHARVQNHVLDVALASLPAVPALVHHPSLPMLHLQHKMTPFLNLPYKLIHRLPPIPIRHAPRTEILHRKTLPQKLGFLVDEHRMLQHHLMSRRTHETYLSLLHPLVLLLARLQDVPMRLHKLPDVFVLTSHTAYLRMVRSLVHFYLIQIKIDISWSNLCFTTLENPKPRPQSARYCG